MFYILSIVFAALLVVAQTSWKLAVGSSQSPFEAGISLASIVRFAFTPLVLLGIALYVAGVFLYMYLLSKYQFSLVQSLAIPLSLIFSVTVASVYFGEKLSAINYVGLVVIVLGIVLVTQR